MASFDPELGKRIGRWLQDCGIETPMDKDAYGSMGVSTRFDTIAGNQANTMSMLGLDLEDDSLTETPVRVAKMFCGEIFTGLNYDNFPKCTAVDNKMNHNELVIIKGADVLSMCEHHFVPFIGQCSVGYIPKTKVMGLSKFPRVIDFFSRRPQIQERLTAQIHAALCFILETEDVAVTMKAEHMCMKLRGVKQSNAETITTKVTGRFYQKPELREEFLLSLKG